MIVSHKYNPFLIENWILKVAVVMMAENQFSFQEVQVNYYHGGKGFPLLLVHGSGPGASSLGNWRAVLEPLARHFEVFAMDLVGFGKSGRKPAPPYFDFDLWVAQTRAMLDHIGDRPVGLIGHSLSGAIALTIAAANPQIKAVMTTGTMGAPFEATDETRRTWRCPRNRQELVAALSGLIQDTSVIDESYLAAREPVIFAPGYADYFDDMFQGDPSQYIQAAVLSDDTLRAIDCPVLLLHGRDDVAFPSASSVQIAQRLARADLMLLSHCSHSVAVERSDTFLALADAHFGTLAH